MDELKAGAIFAVRKLREIKKAEGGKCLSLDSTTEIRKLLSKIEKDYKSLLIKLGEVYSKNNLFDEYKNTKNITDTIKQSLTTITFMLENDKK